MKHVLHNGKISAEFSDFGAELRSLKTADGTEYLWQGRPEYWDGRSPVLFPIVGRLTDGKFTYRGAVYNMKIHGFARHSAFRIPVAANDKIVFELSQNAETQKEYPFEFNFTVSYTLNEDTLSVEYGVENTGRDNLYFSVGGHPGFNVPLGCDGRFEDWFLQFEPKAGADKLILTSACYMTDGIEPCSLPGGRLNLKHSLFDNDAIVLTNMPRSVTLKSDKSSRSVTVSYDGMKYLGLWHKPQTDAPYVCIEPWTGLPAYDGVIDDLATKRDMTVLAAGQNFKCGFSIKIR